jgi:N-acetylmuramoyl-L-alanine amidase
MDIIQIPSPNCSGRRNYIPEFIVNHISAGSLSSMDNWFQNKKAEASSHFGIGKDGSIHQYVPEHMTAWTNGYVSNPDNPITSKYQYINPNWVCLTIEHEGQSGDELTEEQYQSTLWLHKDLMQRHEIPVENILGHYQIDPLTRSGCPGSGFPWERLLKDLGSEKEVVWMNWKDILNKVSANPDDWEKAITTAMNAANADGSMGDLEIMKFLPALIEKIYNNK